MKQTVQLTIRMKKMKKIKDMNQMGPRILSACSIDG